MVDGGLAENAAGLAQAVAALPNGGAVKTLFNTHWHPEQTGSNEAVGKAGGTIISHEVSKLSLQRKERSALYAGFYGPLRATRSNVSPLRRLRAGWSGRVGRVEHAFLAEVPCLLAANCAATGLRKLQKGAVR